MDLVYHRRQIDAVAKAFWQKAADKKIFGFDGPLGAGKTTFIHALCNAIGVKSHVSSPTFSLINEYIYPGGKIFHIDLYRLKDEDEAMRAGVEDCIYSGAICLVEWASRAPRLFDSEALMVEMEVVDPETRRILTRQPKDELDARFNDK